jgi:hypothetical protein
MRAHTGVREHDTGEERAPERREREREKPDERGEEKQRTHVTTRQKVRTILVALDTNFAAQAIVHNDLDHAACSPSSAGPPNSERERERETNTNRNTQRQRWETATTIGVSEHTGECLPLD